MKDCYCGICFAKMENIDAIVCEKCKTEYDRKPKISSAEDFYKWYAQNSCISVAKLREMGGYAVPCYCENRACTGWEMKFKTISEGWE